jgi:hypothetical protein
MIVGFKNIEDVDERKKAIGVPIAHKGITKMFWCPKSLIENIGRDIWKRDGFIEVPDWFYDRKISELFFD